MTENEIVGELLTRLERREAELLEWGFYDVSHSAEEIIELFAEDPRWGDKFHAITGPGGEALFVDDLASSHLLYRLPGTFPTAYRSRFAESVRLLARLRQRFRPDDWTHAPELVSETRLHLSPRRFPKRDRVASDAWDALQDAAWAPAVQRAVLDALCRTPTGGLRLAAFQVRAASRILRHYQGGDVQTGTVVTAGTGGGKTKSFYIPAFMGIAADLTSDSRHSTKVLAIYPRNVLLADQFSEAADQAMVVNRALSSGFKRPICVGALVGDVPFSADFEKDQRNRYALSAWLRSRRSAGHLVPHLRDPSTGETLVWLDIDRLAGKTVVRRDRSPNEVVFPDGVVLLTRQDLIARPPDIFLTSIEMLNKELSAETGRALLGFGRPNPALRLILLDEIHTYEGITGAQVPWILRRLSYWTRSPRRGGAAHYVGLSATLQDAPNHLATLTGVGDTMIDEVFPDPSDSETSVEGNEYNVVLKSHAGSGAGALATSIQSVMLGTRLLTPRTGSRSRAERFDPGYFFGSKVFGFTDNLDVVNRWLPNFVDAERIKRLARLRASFPGDHAQDAAGQVWKLPEEIGHDLNARLNAGRTSSQDPGVDAGADVVLATSALEVGFDDPDVGMVLQHKAPRSAASFLQRKGRAGRRKGVRPWTVVVLSDQGRDRWAFRDSERLFAPVLDRLSLPVFNPYVLRIQATWFLVDWIAEKVGRGIPSLYLSRPTHADSRAEEVVRALVEDSGQRDALTRDLANWLKHGYGGFRVSDPEAMARDILWSPPRAVLRHVVPELWKQMAFGFADVSMGRRMRLLPKYIPTTTWDVLDAQDVELELPGQVQAMDAGRALREVVPGRVSRRYAVDVREPSKWLAWSVNLLSDPIPTSASIEDLVGAFSEVDDFADLAIFQPTRVVLVDVPSSIKNSSNADWSWEIAARPVGERSELDLHAGPLMSALFSRSCAWLHREQAHVRMFRYARSCRYEVHLDGGRVKRGRLGVTSATSQAGDRPAAIGFARAVDALELHLNTGLLESRPNFPTEALRSFLSIYFRYRAAHSEVLQQATSVFGINLLCTSALGMLTATALRQRVPLSKAWELIPSKRDAARKVLLTILSAEAADDDHNHGNDGRRTNEMLELWALPEIEAEVGRLLEVLWSPPDAEFDAWLDAVFIETVRAAIETAVHVVLPEVPDGDFNVDVVRDGDVAAIIVSEADAGGVGILERLLTEIAAHPGIFDSAVDAAIADCRNERLTETVIHAVRLARAADTPLALTFESVRHARTYHDLQFAKDDLVAGLERIGCQADKEAVTALLGKALLPGSNRQTDRWLDGLTRSRLRVSERLGLTVDIRLFAYWLMGLPKARQRISATMASITAESPSATQVFHSLVRLTLDPCRDSCPECLGTARELEGLSPSRRLVRLWLSMDKLDQMIDVDDGDLWLSQLDTALSTGSRLRLRHSASQRTKVAEHLAGRLAREFDRGFTSTAFRIAAVRRFGGGWETHVHVDDTEVA